MRVGGRWETWSENLVTLSLGSQVGDAQWPPWSLGGWENPTGRHAVSANDVAGITSAGTLATPQVVAVERRLRHRGGGCLPTRHTTGKWQSWDLDPGLSDIIDCETRDSETGLSMTTPFPFLCLSNTLGQLDFSSLGPTLGNS